jgi:hypothetical protein
MQLWVCAFIYSRVLTKTGTSSGKISDWKRARTSQIYLHLKVFARWHSECGMKWVLPPATLIRKLRTREREKEKWKLIIEHSFTGNNSSLSTTSSETTSTTTNPMMIIINLFYKNISFINFGLSGENDCVGLKIFSRHSPFNYDNFENWFKVCVCERESF